MARQRNAKGRFVKGGGSKRSVSIVRRSSSPIVIRETRSAVPRKRGGGGRRSGAASGAGMKSRRIGLLKGGFILGYVEKNYSAEVWDKIPALKGSKDLVIALGGHFLLKARSGTLLGDITDAATAHVGRTFGGGMGNLLAGDDASWE